MRIARLNQLYSKTINFTSYNLNFANLTDMLSFSLLRVIILIEYRMFVKGYMRTTSYIPKYLGD